MKKFIAAFALTIVLPAVAYAQEAPAEQDCCERMKAEGKECCCDDMAEGHTEPAMDHDAHQ